VIENSSSLKIHPLVFVKEKTDIMVGRLDIDSFALFPSDGVALLQQMQVGLSPEQAATWYEEQYHETIDINDFLETLQDLRFIREDGEAEAPVAFQLSRPISWLAHAVFSPVAWVLYAALFVYCIYNIIRFPILFPNYSNVFFSPSFTIVEMGLFFGQFPGLLFHESFHMLAGRRLGIPSRLSVGRRLYFVVAETILTGLWSVPPRYRYLPFLAGMLADIIWFSALTVIAGMFIGPAGRFTVVGAVCIALAFETVFRFLWQFYFYLRTDLYYVFMNIFGCVDLHHTANRYLRNRILRLIGRTDKMEDEALWNPQDRRLARWYAPFYIFGYMLTITVSLTIGLPITIQFFTGIFDHLISGYAHLTAPFWDSVVFLALNVVQLAVVAAVLWREHKKKIAARAKGSR
jgi:hypothetical protein